MHLLCNLISKKFPLRRRRLFPTSRNVTVKSCSKSDRQTNLTMCLMTSNPGVKVEKTAETGHSYPTQIVIICTTTRQLSPWVGVITGESRRSLVPHLLLITSCSSAFLWMTGKCDSANYSLARFPSASRAQQRQRLLNTKH